MPGWTCRGTGCDAATYRRPPNSFCNACRPSWRGLHCTIAKASGRAATLGRIQALCPVDHKCLNGPRHASPHPDPKWLGRLAVQRRIQGKQSVQRVLRAACSPAGSSTPISEAQPVLDQSPEKGSSTPTSAPQPVLDQSLEKVVIAKRVGRAAASVSDRSPLSDLKLSLQCVSISAPARCSRVG